VIEEIDNIKNTGRVRIGKDEWRADGETDEAIPEGKIVEVTRVDGTHLVVKISKEGE
jgi:membrane protein implicated in regulation of membrane protease activity